VTFDVLEVEGEIGDGAEQRQADDEADCTRDAEDAVAEDLQRQDRLSSPRFYEHECGERDDARRDQGDHLHRAPGVGGATEARVQHDRRETACEEGRAEVVDLVLDLVGASVEGGSDHGERDQPDRDVDVEDPAPGEVVDEEAAEQRPDHGRDAEDAAEEALVAAALARRDDVADHGDRDHEQAAAAQSLDRPEEDQLGHVLADSAQRGADEEDHDRRLQYALSAVQVAQLPVEGSDDRRGEQIGGDDPRELRDAAEVADDRRERGRDDRLVERSEKQHQQQRPEDQTHPRLLGDLPGHRLCAARLSHRYATRAGPSRRAGPRRRVGGATTRRCRSARAAM
jgi:hypothetical protein